MINAITLAVVSQYTFYCVQKLFVSDIHLMLVLF